MNLAPASVRLPWNAAADAIRRLDSRPTVLLVPGFNSFAVLLGWASAGTTCLAAATPLHAGDVSYFAEMPNWLISDGLDDVRLVSFENNPRSTPSIEINSACLRQQVLAAVESSDSGSIVIVAHSMGGLVVRAYLDSSAYEEDVARVGHNFITSVFMVSVPNQSMPFHFWLNLMLNCEAKDSPQRAACEFSSTAWVKEFNQRHPHANAAVKYYLLGGTWYSGLFGDLAGTYICLVMGPNDATIPTASAITLAGAYQSAVFREAHNATVGTPSYFVAAPGKHYSAAYQECVRKVLVEGQVNGCQSSAALVCPHLVEMTVGALGLGGLILYWRRQVFISAYQRSRQVQ